jgi:hypothetical protein
MPASEDEGREARRPEEADPDGGWAPPPPPERGDPDGGRPMPVGEPPGPIGVVADDVRVFTDRS